MLCISSQGWGGSAVSAKDCHWCHWDMMEQWRLKVRAWWTGRATEQGQMERIQRVHSNIPQRTNLAVYPHPNCPVIGSLTAFPLAAGSPGCLVAH